MINLNTTDINEKTRDSAFKYGNLQIFNDFVNN